jgi:hypothetical protein
VPEKSYWGDLKNLQTPPTPVSFLKEQLSYLYKDTDGRLKGKIGMGTIVGREFTYSLSIVAPSINNYEKLILEIAHNLVPYPVMILDRVNNKNYSCNDEITYLKTLEEILSSPGVIGVIKGLLSLIVGATK